MFGCWSQWHSHLEHVAIIEYRLACTRRVVRQIQMYLANTGAEFLIATNLEHELADGWVLGERCKIAGINATVIVRDAGIQELNAVVIDYHRGRGGAST